MQVLAGARLGRVAAAEAVQQGAGPGGGARASAGAQRRGAQPDLLQHADQQLVHVVLDAAGGLDEFRVARRGEGFSFCKYNNNC